jgi:uncharacterized protein (TIGR02145 family)
MGCGSTSNYGALYNWYAVHIYVNRNTYGGLYNWYAASKNGGAGVGSIAPTGWHVPTPQESVTLRSYLDPINLDHITNIAGGKMKEQGLISWLTPNTGATNSSGFTAVGAGIRDENGTFANINGVCELWNTRDESAEYGGVGLLQYDNEVFHQALNSSSKKKYGCSIRCIKNTTTLTNGQTSTVTDIDGNVYPTICIGTQEWMASNLKVTKFNDGVLIPEVTDNTAWAALTTPGRCWYNNDINQT